MVEFISRSYVEETTHYSHDFRNSGEGAFGGFSFECDKDGKVDVKSLNPAALKNYNGCINGTFEVVDNGVAEYTSRYRHPSVIRCIDCRHEVTLGNFTNTCECGADYNNSGSKLVDRRLWGEETGEHWTECI
jgi:uncharacterized CHY-type Zn-finger protein